MAQKPYNVILSRRADGMLLFHTEFLARVSTVGARKLLAAFKKASGMLEDNPLVFAFADEADAPGIPPETYRKCIFYERYKALFLVEDSNVYVDVIIDCRQENKDLF